MSKNKKQRNMQKKIITPKKVNKETILERIFSVGLFLLGIGVNFMNTGRPIIADILYIMSGILFIVSFFRSEATKQYKRKIINQFLVSVITIFIITVVIVINHFYLNKKPPELFTQNFPGFSLHSLIKINDISANRKKYLFDLGQVNGSRFSVYISTDNIFTFSFIDAVGEPHNIQLPIGSNGIPFGKQFYLICELGIDGQSTLLRMLIDGKEIKSIQLPFKVDLGGIDVPGAVVGADLNGENGASFDMGNLIVLAETLTSSQITEVIKVNYNQSSKQHFATFNGKQWMRANKTGFRDLVQNNRSLQPIWK
jgi:hypothetical protein